MDYIFIQFNSLEKSITREMYQQIFGNCFQFVTNAIVHIILPAFIPFVLFPLIIGFAAQNIYCGITVFIVLTWIFNYADWICKSCNSLTAYFFTWSFWSLIYLWILFKLTIPHDAYTSIEYRIHYWSLFTAFVCFCTTRYLALDESIEDMEHVDDANQYRIVVESNPNELSKPQETQSNTQNMTLEMDENVSKCQGYSIWLNCAINNSNRLDFMLANLLTALALFHGINLTNLTTCQPTVLKLLHFYYGDNVSDMERCDSVFYHLSPSVVLTGCIYACAMAISCLFTFFKQLQLFLRSQAL